MYKQLDIFDLSAGKSLAVTGMNMAVDTANTEHPGWSDRCWQLFVQWLNRKPRYFLFMVEDFRKYLYDYDLIERPKTDRAFGFLTGKAVRAGLIENCGTKKVSNKKAHATPAGLWMKK